MHKLSDRHRQETVTSLSAWCNLKEKLTRPAHGQGLNHKAKNFIIKAKDFKQVLKDIPRPRPRLRTNIADNVQLIRRRQETRLYGLSAMSEISKNVFKMGSPRGNLEVESVKHIYSRPIIMVDMSARRDEFSIVCGKCLWIVLVWK